MPEPKLKDVYISAADWTSVILPILSKGYKLRIPLKGMSMYPLLVGGRDEAVISSIGEKKPVRGDIVLYVDEDGIHALHRIHHVKGKNYYLLGDSQTWIEGPIKEDAVLAVATEVIRKGKRISCNKAAYKFFAELWLLARPIRPGILYIARKFRSFIGRISR